MLMGCNINNFDLSGKNGAWRKGHFDPIFALQPSDFKGMAGLRRPFELG
jgi:hypothetical protein